MPDCRANRVKQMGADLSPPRLCWLNLLSLQANAFYLCKLLICCRGFVQRKVSPGSLLIIAASFSSAAGDPLSGNVSFRGSLLFIAASYSSVAGDLFSGKVFFEALFFIATSSSSAAGDSISGKIFFQALFSSLQQAHHQLQGICSAEKFFFEAFSSA